MSLRVLTWNLKHGRAVPSAHRDLFAEFAAALGRWEWDVALLQEVPPWWPARLGYESAEVLTSRNFAQPLRRAVAQRWPDLIRSNGGGCNAVLTRGARIVERRTMRLALWPERRWLLGVRLEQGIWVGNLHTSGRGPDEPQRAASVLRSWAGERATAVLGGDFNLRELSLPGFVWAGGVDVDHVFAQGLVAAGPPDLPARGHLSDHAPVIVGLTPAAPRWPAPAR